MLAISYTKEVRVRMEFPGFKKNISGPFVKDLAAPRPIYQLDI
jgi:hypothetical protein